jgi:hypothetical protein
MHSNSNFESNKPAKARRAKLELSRHAGKRMQQRSISELQIELVRRYGEIEHDGNGGIRHMMTNKAMNNLMHDLGHSPQIERLRDVYVVTDTNDEVVITVAHRYH